MSSGISDYLNNIGVQDSSRFFHRFFFFDELP